MSKRDKPFRHFRLLLNASVKQLVMKIEKERKKKKRDMEQDAYLHL